MYGVFVIINGSAQLKKINPDFIDNIQYQLNGIAENFGFSIISNQQSMYSYFLPFDHIESVEMTLELMQSINNLLKKQEDNLYGYNIFLQSCDNQENPKLGSWHYLVNRDNEMWMVSHLKKKFERGFVIEEKGAISQIIKIIPIRQFDNAIKDQIYENHKVYNAVSKSIESGGAEVLHFVSVAGHGGHEIVNRLWNENYADSNDCSMFYLHADGSSIDEFYPFRRALDPRIIANLIETESSHDDINSKRLIKWIGKFNHKNFTISGDMQSENLYYLFQLYIPLYAKSLSKKCPILMIETVKKFRKSSAKLLRHIVDLALENKLIVIHITDQHKENLANTNEKVEILGNSLAQNFLKNNKELKYNNNYLAACDPLAVLLFYWNSQEIKKNYSGKLTLNSVSQWVLNNCDNFSLEVLYMIYLADGMIPCKWIFDAMGEGNFWKAVIQKRFKMLANLGLIRDIENRPSLSYKFLATIVSYVLGAKVQVLKQKMAKILLSKKDYYEQISLIYLLQFLSSCHYIEEALNVLDDLLHQKVVSEEANLSEWLRYKLSGKNIDSALQKRLNYILERYKLIYHVKFFSNSRLENANIDYRNFKDSTKSSLDMKGARLLLQHYITQESSSQIIFKDHAKKEFFVMKDLVYIFQKYGDINGELSAFLEMAYGEFMEHRLRPSLDYCDVVQQISEKTHNVWYSLVVKKLMGIHYFVYGDFHKALEIVTAGVQESMNYGYSRKELFFRFFLVRIMFEFGEYIGSLKQLDNIEKVAKMYNYNWVLPVVNCWKGRCLGHAGRLQEALDYLTVSRSCESHYYLSEIYWLFDYKKEAVQIGKNLLNILTTVRKRPCIMQLDIEDWTSGYSLIEGYIEKTYLGFDVLEKLSQGIAYYMSGLMGMNNERKMALSEFENFCELQEAMPNDPYSYIYSYYHMQLCENDNEKRMCYNRANRILNTRLNRCTGLRERKLLEKGYYAQELLAYKFSQ